LGRLAGVTLAVLGLLLLLIFVPARFWLMVTGLVLLILGLLLVR